jgi:hypothetical protein
VVSVAIFGRNPEVPVGRGCRGYSSQLWYGRWRPGILIIDEEVELIGVLSISCAFERDGNEDDDVFLTRG